MPRKHIKEDIETKVLTRAKRRCALCFGLDFDTERRKGQIAHIDHDSTNAKYANLVFLCLEHHEEYDSKSQQAKGITQKELKFYRAKLDEYLEDIKGSPWIDSSHDSHPPDSDRWLCTLDTYNLKIEMYRIVRDYLKSVIREANVKYQVLFTFVQATDEALFVFDREISDHLMLIYKKSIALNTVNKFLADPSLPIGDRRNKLADNDAELLSWFTDQIDEVRAMFYKHISL